MSILRAIKTIKIPPLEGVERSKQWSDLFECDFIRRFVKEKWERLMAFLLWKSTDPKTPPKLRKCCRCIFCGFYCCTKMEDEDVTKGPCGDCDHRWETEFFNCDCCLGKNTSGGRRKRGCCDRGRDKIRVRMTEEQRKGLKPTRVGEKDRYYREIEDETKLESRDRHKRKKVREQLIRVEAIPEVEWRPMGRPRFCGVQ